MIGTIHILKNSIAQKIAAGEVIERPASAVRELIDNALDAGSSEMDISIGHGGISSIRIADNGSGMAKEDLELCHLPHATSKIEHEDDLLKITSLGFRGEALSSIGSCSKLQITSKTAHEEAAYRLTVHNGKRISLTPCKGNVGTIVEVNDLFSSLPARRQFLKNTAAESGMCKTTLLEKALCFPSVRFTYRVDGEIKVNLPSQDLKDRVFDCYSHMLQKEYLFEYSYPNDIGDITIIAQRPEINRKDRKMIHIFANSRKIYEYAFIHAVEYGYSDYLPGGTYPVAFVFLNIAPDRIDFNIHPAKREARFKDQQKIHHAISKAFQSALEPFRLQPGTSSSFPKPSRGGGGTVEEKPSPYYRQEDLSFHTIMRRPHMPKSGTHDEKAAGTGEQFGERESGVWSAPIKGPDQREQAGKTTGAVREEKLDFIGSLFDLFLLFQGKEIFYIVDQHAAHERLLYEQFSQKNQEADTLLTPLPFLLNSFEDKILKINREVFSRYGLKMSPTENKHEWRLETLPVVFSAPPEQAIESIRRALAEPDSLKRELFADLACKQAIKDGEKVDAGFAHKLMTEVAQLDNARCPHGRPIWYSLSKRELFYLVGRL